MSLSACKTFNNSFSNEDFIISEIAKIENIENFSDETIKTIAVIFMNSNQTQNINKSNLIKNNRIKNLVNKVKSKKLNKIITLNFSNDTWSEKISKVEILEFLKSKNIEPANLNNFELLNENNFTKKIILSSHNINFLDFAKYFNLKSNYNIIITIDKQYLNISGYGNSFDFDCDIQTIEELSKTGLTYNEILDKIS